MKSTRNSWAWLLAMLLVATACGGSTRSVDTIAHGVTASLPQPATPSLTAGVSVSRRVPFPFERNVGQASADVHFLLRSGSLHVGLTDTGLRLALMPVSGEGPSSGRQIYIVSQELVGATARPPVGTRASPTVLSYLGWPDGLRHAAVPVYDEVAYQNAWTGIDAVYQRGELGVKSAYRVAPGADANDIQLLWHGAEAMLREDGRLVLETPAGRVTETPPLAWQELTDGRRPVAVRWRAVPSGWGLGWGFQVGEHDRSLPLIIDPDLSFATYLGGGTDDLASAVTVDSNRATYIVGQTAATQTSFPDGDPNANQTIDAPGFDRIHNGGTDAFVAKLNAAGTGLEYVSFIGGSGDDVARAIAVDSMGAAYVSGWTDSTAPSFPDGNPNGNASMDVPGYDQTHNGEVDVFLVKLQPSGTALEYATFLGGAGRDEARGVAVDDARSAYVTGETLSSGTSFPNGSGMSGQVGFNLTFSGGLGQSDAFVVKLNPAGTSVSYATYVGGGGTDVATGIAVDSGRAAYVVGYTTSTETSFPDGDPNTNDAIDVPGFDRSHNGGVDAFVLKIAAGGASLGYVTFIGGAQDDVGAGIALDSVAAAYIVGHTGSDQGTFPDGDPNANNAMDAPGFDQVHNGGNDAFVAKLSSTGAGLTFVTYLGGAGDDIGTAIAVGPGGLATAVGYTDSSQTSFPDGDPNANDAMDAPGYDQTYNGGALDGFVVGLTAAGTGLTSASYVGGAGNDRIESVAMDAASGVYLAGFADSTQSSFPDGDPNGNDTIDAPGFDRLHNGQAGLSDALAVRLCPVTRPNVQVAAATNGLGGIGVTVTAGLGAVTHIEFLGASSAQNPAPNVLVDIGGQNGQTGQFTYIPPSPTSSVTFTIRRQSGSGAGTLPMIVTDGCGAWQTFVGGGANAWPGGNAPLSAAPLSAPPAPTATVGRTLPPAPGAACASFATHAQAQAYLRRDPSDPLLIDRNRNGIACEGADGAGFVNPPLDSTPVSR